MPQSSQINRRIVLRSRPVGAPKPEDFGIEEAPVPTPTPYQILLRTLDLSLDPYMRGRMSDARSYAASVAIGDVIVGATPSPRVETSHHPDFHEGDVVLSYNGWQDYAVSDGTGVTKLNERTSPHSLALGVLGMPGFTGYMGLLDIGQPKKGETVVVAAASGPVGSIVGQIAKIHGCRAIGIAGGHEKCRFVVEEFGFDACIDRRTGELRQQLSHACPSGVDIYFENVGGDVFDAVLPLLNPRARVPVCGLISHYNDTELPPGPNRLPHLMRTILTKRIKMQGFIISEDYRHLFGGFFNEMSLWLQEGKIKYREDIVEGLENAPQAFIGLLEGKNFGKLVVRVALDQATP